MYCNDKSINLYISEKAKNLNCRVAVVKGLKDCAAVTYTYNNKFESLVSDELPEQELLFALLHELSHVELGYIGEKFQKKGIGSWVEKKVDMNVVSSNRKIIKNRNIVFLYLLALIYEPWLVKKIKFGGKQCT